MEDGGQISNVNRSLKTQPSHQILPLEFHLFSSHFGITPKFKTTLTLPLDFSLGFFLDFFDIFSTGPGRGDGELRILYEKTQIVKRTQI